MKRIERKQLESIKAIADKPTFFVRAFCEGLGVIMSDGFAYVGNAVIDLRFDNLKPEIKIQK
jgi:hypothetical protein